MDAFWLELLKTSLFVLHLEVEVTVIKGLQADETVLGAGRIAASIRVEGERLNGTEVALDAAKLLLEDEVEEAALELARLRVGGGYLHRLLTTADDDVVEDGRDGRRVHRAVGDEGLQVLEGVGVEELK